MNTNSLLSEKNEISQDKTIFNKSFLEKEEIINHKGSNSLFPNFLYQSNPFNDNLNFKDNNTNKQFSKIKMRYNDNYIKQIKFLPNNKELVLITNKNQIIINSIEVQKILSYSKEENFEKKSLEKESVYEKSEIIFQENNHIYDIEM